MKHQKEDLVKVPTDTPLEVNTYCTYPFGTSEGSHFPQYQEKPARTAIIITYWTHYSSKPT